MPDKEIIIFLALFVLILLVLVGAIVVFVVESRRKFMRTQEQLKQNRIKTHNFIARTMHDDIAQSIYSSTLLVQQIDYENLHPELADRLKEIVDHLTSASESVRTLARDIKGIHIIADDLIDLLRHECNKVNCINDIAVELHSNVEKVETSYLVRATLIQMNKEALQNSIRHSKCLNIRTQITNNIDGLTILVVDDGIGFKVDDVRRHGIGLINFQENADEIGATLTIKSELGKGTSISIFLAKDKLNPIQE